MRGEDIRRHIVVPTLSDVVVDVEVADVRMFVPLPAIFVVTFLLQARNKRLPHLGVYVGDDRMVDLRMNISWNSLILRLNATEYVPDAEGEPLRVMVKAVCGHRCLP